MKKKRKKEFKCTLYAKIKVLEILLRATLIGDTETAIFTSRLHGHPRLCLLSMPISWSLAHAPLKSEVRECFWSIIGQDL